MAKEKESSTILETIHPLSRTRRMSCVTNAATTRQSQSAATSSCTARSARFPHFCKFFSTSPQPPRYAACVSLAELETKPGAACRLGHGAKKSVKVFKARSRYPASALTPRPIRNDNGAVLSGARKTAKTGENTRRSGACRRPTRQGRKPIIAQTPRLYR